MRVYDIALMYLRAIAVIDLLRWAVDLPFNALGLVGALGLGGNPHVQAITAVKLFNTTAEALIFSGALLLLSKPIARFAAKLAAVSDTANQF